MAEHTMADSLGRQGLRVILADSAEFGMRSDELLEKPLVFEQL
jgi:hypothetical protein